MRRMMLFIACCWIMILNTSCKDQRVLEQLGFTNTSSYDLVRDESGGRKLLLVANSIPKTSPEASEPREILFTTSRTSKEARIIMSRQTNRIIVSGQLRNTMFGLDLAKDGIWEHIDTLIRDPAIGSRVKVTIVNGKAFDLLKKDYPQHPPTGSYINHLLEKESNAGVIPQVNLYQFSRDYLDDGIDPVAPIIKDYGDHVITDGIALFRGDRYQTKINPDQSLIFAYLRGDFKQGEISIDMSDGEHKEILLFSSVQSKRKVKVKHVHDSDSHFRVDISLKIQGSVLEYIGPGKISMVNDQKAIERRMEEYTVEHAEKLIKLMQKNKADSIGIGQYVRNSMSYREWKQLDWMEVYPKIDVNITADINIKDFGKVQNVE